MGLALLPDGRMLVTERSGQLRIVERDGRLSEPLAGVPEVVARGQGGLLDITLSPQFAQDQFVYLSYAEPGEDGAGTAVARGRLGERALENVQVIWRQTPKVSGNNHWGSRLVFRRDGALFVTLERIAHGLSAHWMPACAGMEQPIYYWDPVIAPSGAVFYTGTVFPDWQGDLFVGSLKPGLLVRLRLDSGRVVQEERYLGELDERLREVVQGPDGFLYVLTDSGNGRILRIEPDHLQQR